MNAEILQQLAAGGHYPGRQAPLQLIETHISWVLLSPDFAFKIKKPVSLHFLDFSTPEKRYFYCCEELRLNRRMAPQMYLAVLPVGIHEQGYVAIGENIRDLLDYAIQMVRLDSRRQMDLLLAQDRVSESDMDRLAEILAEFHLGHRIIPPVQENADQDIADFSDFFDVSPEIIALFGEEAEAILQNWQQSIPEFLRRHHQRMQARAKAGYFVDGHGDLHARNIFLMPEPVVFDCIEFNDHFRQIDVLSELAFLCMDLDVTGKPHLAEHFMDHYKRFWECMPEPEDQALFHYFKAYRANVRLKVLLLAYRQEASPEIPQKAGLYWSLLQLYLQPLLSS